MYYGCGISNTVGYISFLTSGLYMHMLFIEVYTFITRMMNTYLHTLKINWGKSRDGNKIKCLDRSNIGTVTFIH